MTLNSGSRKSSLAGFVALGLFGCALAGATARAGEPKHVYEHGPHGVGLGVKIPGTCHWPEQCQAWLRARGLLSAKE